jgi:hypothetical protein
LFAFLIIVQTPYKPDLDLVLFIVFWILSGEACQSKVYEIPSRLWGFVDLVGFVFVVFAGLAASWV